MPVERVVAEDEQYCDVVFYGDEGNEIYYPVVNRSTEDETVTISSQKTTGIPLSSGEISDIRDNFAGLIGLDKGDVIYQDNPNFNALSAWFEI